MILHSKPEVDDIAGGHFETDISITKSVNDDGHIVERITIHGTKFSPVDAPECV